ncbi:hypothetical protein LEP1GSC178_3229 [Leptospira licerasiae str. MMD4847]|uniref:Uncharacterized protein n=1 Tax=Leptospira licerasiae str. MMD4847 TaxID=1049971 RepID=A0ABN0H9X1_9LEPT|nr:hypothetical protein LEP1GSC178_3229 [Leptospira licerasiae str. MMD4847]
MFTKAGADLYSSDQIIWVDDSLPSVTKLSDYNSQFDFTFTLMSMLEFQQANIKKGG